MGANSDILTNSLQIPSKYENINYIGQFPRTYNNLVKEFGLDVINDAKNSSLPPITAGGTIYNIIDNWGTITDKIKFLINQNVKDEKEEK